MSLTTSGDGARLGMIVNQDDELGCWRLVHGDHSQPARSNKKQRGGISVQMEEGMGGFIMFDPEA